ncbi:LysR family transcriptional regulator [Paenibacillus chartarius]|uniref:LysR family transcriptional regulator n=1 Tax=Paenibacillus chartarius TaxID=747481 RepID=A0ABV6DFJ2_9BACL
MEVRNLRYVLEVAKQRNVTKAAETLHLTQPTLSKIIKSLEDELGVDLFDRSSKAVKLTDSGAAAMPQIQTILQAVDDLYVKLADVSELKTGRMKLGLPPVVSTVFFPRVFAEFHRLYPNIEFQIFEEGAKKIELLISEGEIDLGVVVAPVDETEFGVMPLIEEKLAVTLHVAHPLSDRTEIGLNELRADPFIMFPRGFAVREHVMKACQQQGFDPKILYESSHWDLLAEMVAENLGVSIMPGAICNKIVNPRVRTVTLVEPVIPWNLAMIWRKEKYLTYAMKRFMSLSREYVNMIAAGSSSSLNQD